jgi:hypothetical protein
MITEDQIKAIKLALEYNEKGDPMKDAFLDIDEGECIIEAFKIVIQLYENFSL